MEVLNLLEFGFFLSEELSFDLQHFGDSSKLPDFRLLEPSSDKSEFRLCSFRIIDGEDKDWDWFSP